MSTIRLAVLMGGPSPEHPVSLKSAAVVIRECAPTRYQVFPFLMTRDLGWVTQEEPHEGPFDAAALAACPPWPRGRALEHLASMDCAFLAIHGGFGEDGRLQGLLDCLGVPYTGSGVAGSALAIDKIRTREVLSAHGLPVAPGRALGRRQVEADPDQAALLAELGPRLVVKSPTKGSSFGVFMVEEPEQLAPALRAVLEDEDRVLVEARLAGRELTCGVLDPGAGGAPRPLPPTEIMPPEGRYFDFDAKYTPGVSREVTPPEDMPGSWIREVQTLALEVHRILGLEGMSRCDFMVSAAGRATILEVNTIPGLTETSLLPQAARVAGIPFPDLVDQLVAEALSRVGPRPTERSQAES